LSVIASTIKWGLCVIVKTKQMTAIAAIMIVACSATPAMAGTATGNGKVTVYETLNFAVLLEMDFGKIVTDTSGGMVDLDPVTNARNCPSNLDCIGTFSFARLQLTGSDAQVSVNYDPNFQLTGPGDSITVEPTFSGGQGAIVQLTGGSASFDFGAKLHVNPSQLAGSYSGEFTVDIDYQ
jgi:Mat/Ecp fimbriae major subunit